MILPTPTTNQTTSAGPFGLPALGSARSSLSPDSTACRLQIDRVVRQIESPEVREIVGFVFDDLLRLLECLGLTEDHLRTVDAAQETFALFQMIHDEACALVKFIREDALTCEALNEELRDTLDGITFVINHDLQRVFETRQPVTNENGIEQVVFGKLFRAQDVFTNCLQQSTISLAIMFDPELVGTKLFNNSDRRYRESVQLCEDLMTLEKLIEAYEESQAEPAFAKLTAGIETFRNRSMECLMYSDWPQFESFCERIQLAAGLTEELVQLFHQFRCYVETLLGQVRMRAVLANVFPIEFGSGDNRELPSSAQNSPAFYESVDFEDDNSWNTFAIAV